MALPPLTTILNNAPLIIQGTNKLISLIRNRNQEEVENQDDQNDNGNDVSDKLDDIQAHLKTNDEANIQQIKLIEELAKQNETLASSLQHSIKQLKLVAMIAIIAMIIAAASLLIN